MLPTERIMAIAIKDGQIYRIEGNSKEWIIYRNSEYVGQLKLKPLDLQLLGWLLKDKMVPQTAALELYKAGKRHATISEAIRHINEALRDALDYPQTGTQIQYAMRTLKKSRTRSEAEIINDLSALKGISYFVSASESDYDVWKDAAKHIERSTIASAVKIAEIQRLQPLLLNIDEAPSVDLTNHLRVLLICEPDAKQTIMVQLMQTLANFSNIILEVNQQPDFDTKNYLGFIILLTPGLSPFYHETIERVARYADKNQIPLFAFKERSVAQYNLLANWIEYSQENFWFSVSDICEVFQRLYSTHLAERLQQLAHSAPDEYVQKYADLYDVRLLTNIDAKKRIAHAVVQDILNQPRLKSIFLDSGTVTYYIAEKICQEAPEIKIYTNNLSIARLKNMCTRIHLLPGNLDAKVEAAVGLEPAIYLRELCEQGKIDIGVLGLRSYEYDLGFGEDTPTLIEVQRVLFETVPNLVLVAQGEKLFKPVQVPLYNDSEVSNALIQRRREENSLQLYIHEPTLEHVVHLLTPLKTYYNRYQQTLIDLQEALGANAVHLLTSPPVTAVFDLPKKNIV